ncbi:MAG: ammonium transporter, partial [Caldilineales bacterium]|nr:ammonium transporter [Caldilineales bacterium]
MHRRTVRKLAPIGLALILSVLIAGTAFAQGSDEPDTATVASAVDVIWVLVAAFLVFFMQAGFAMVESGLSRAKNAANLLMKNLMDFAVATILFAAIGYGLMFGADRLGLFGGDGFMLSTISMGEGAAF